MKSKAAAAAAEDDEKPTKIRSSRGKRRHGRRSRSSSRSPSGSGSPVRRRPKKPSKKIADKKSSKRSKVSSSRRSRRRRRSLSPDPSLSSRSPSSVSRRYSHRSGDGSTSASERSVSPPPRSWSKDVRKRKGRGMDKDRKHRKRRKSQRSRSCTSSASSSGSSRSRSRSKSKKLRAASSRDDSTRDKIEKDHDNYHASRSEKNTTEDVDRDEDALAIAKKGNNEIDGYKKGVSSEKIDILPSKDAYETGNVLPAGSESPAAEDLELILRQKALENFRKFRQTATLAGKTDNSGATGNIALADSRLQNAGTEFTEARFAAVTPVQMHVSSVGVRHYAESPRLKDFGNGTNYSRKQACSGAISRGTGSPKRMLEAGVTGRPTKQMGSMVEATHSTSLLISPEDGGDRRSIMQRSASIPGTSASVDQRLGGSAGMNHVNGNPNPRVKSVVSTPSREGTTYAATSPRPCENSVSVESCSKVGDPLFDIDRAQGSCEDNKKMAEASASNGSILSPDVGKSQVRTEDKDGSQFQKKTFSRMHDGETVEVSYKVYIPKKTPALARRKLQR